MSNKAWFVIIVYFLPWCVYIYKCSGLLKTYAFDDTTIGSWMIGVQATYIDDNRLCCSSTRQGVNTTLSQKLLTWLTEEYLGFAILILKHESLS